MCACANEYLNLILSPQFMSARVYSRLLDFPISKALGSLFRKGGTKKQSEGGSEICYFTSQSPSGIESFHRKRWFDNDLIHSYTACPIKEQMDDNTGFFAY